MTGPHHRGERLASPVGIRRVGVERTKAAAACEGEGDREGVARRRDLRREVARNACNPQIGGDAPRAETTSAQIARSAFGEHTIIDVAKIGEVRDHGIDLWRRFLPPTALKQFATKIAAQLCLARRIFPDVTQREVAQSSRGKRRTIGRHF